ncbi:stigma-specific STIG1-like protein 1 [Arachis stenosperma]|uniref:stigma-specific STIG1-like protein 1 n=1 Tax=Arachis stenosperma TaxID=217475 RepID=UPI0025ACD2FB|nr:stigma-specific STIG1-like protein 1 [Arachis stenosperma]
MKAIQMVLFLLFILAMLTALVMAELEPQFELASSLRSTKGFHHGRHGVGGAMTCNKYPRVCRVAGSQGPDCCHKKCVNVSTDRNNCGRCGKKCKYSQLCCKGKCVNHMVDKHHCGICGNKCSKGDSCIYGICSYA